MDRHQRDAAAARRRHDETVAQLRHDGAARMRDAALSRHQLLQQVDQLSTSNANSTAALVRHTHPLIVHRITDRGNAVASVRLSFRPFVSALS